MPELPDARRVSAEARDAWRLLAVRAVIGFDLSRAAAPQYDVAVPSD